VEFLGRRSFHFALGRKTAGQHRQWRDEVKPMNKRTFKIGSVEVVLVEDPPGAVMPFVAGVSVGDTLLVSVFYRETIVINGEKMSLLRSKTTTGPVAPGAGSGCDRVSVSLADVEFVRVKALRTLSSVDARP